MELLTKKCPACKSQRVADTEIFTPTGWIMVGVSVAAMIVGFLAIALFQMPPFAAGIFFVGGAGLIGYARSNQMVPSNRCRDCGEKGEFPLSKEFDEAPKDKPA